MTNDVAELVELPYSWTMKAHSSICLQLKKIIDRISRIFSAIESARPRCTSGIQALCSLHFTMDKAKLLIQHCCKSSKLYLAIIGDKIVLRCERIRHALEVSLSQIQNMVPPLLAAKISGIVNDLKCATFTIESSEGEARNILLALLRQDFSGSDSKNSSVLHALQLVALRLHITSPLALLIEKRSLRKLLDKVSEVEAPKKKILKYLLFLLRKYGEAIIMNQVESTLAPHEQTIYPSIELEPHLEYVRDEGQSDASSMSAPTEATCSSSIASFGSSMNNLPLQFSNISLPSSDTSSVNSDLLLNIKNDEFPLMNADYHKSLCFQDSHGIDFTSLPKLAALSWGSQCKAIKDVKDQLRDEKQACYSIFSNHYVKPVIRFLKAARDLCDSTALSDGAQVLLAFLSRSGTDMPPLHDEAIYVLASVLDSEITKEALAIIEVLSSQEYYKTELLALGILPCVLNVLDTKSREFHISAMRILSNLSSNSDILYHAVYLNCIPKLAPFLSDRVLAQYCIKFFRNLCNSKEGRIAVDEHNLCIKLITELLGSGTDEEKEYAVDALLSLCNHFSEYCHMIMEENTIQYVIDISLNGTARGKVISKELLQLLRKKREENVLECSVSLGSSDNSSNSNEHHPKRESSSSKALRYLGRKISRLLRPNS